MSINKGQNRRQQKEAAKHEKFIQRIMYEAILNLRKTHEQSGGRATILTYRKKDYMQIKKYLEEINDTAEGYNIAV